jgi:hypothetical protein
MRKPINPKDFGSNFVCEAPSKRVHSNQPHRPNGMRVRMVTLRCDNCGKLFDVLMNNAKRAKQRCCSRKCGKALIAYFPGGNEKHPLYSRWLAMKQRCLNTKHSSYQNYGGRGIKIEHPLTDFVEYAKHLTGLPGYSENKLNILSLDRIDSADNYRKGNLRWTTHNKQVVNQRTRKNNSGYKGVTWNVNRKTWLVRVTYKGKTYGNTTHASLKVAVKERNRLIREYGLPHEIQHYK